MSFYQGRAYSVLHPTDFSEASELAFAHALAIAIQNKADLTLLHVASDKDQDVDWQEFPSVRKTLERWGILAPGSRRSDVEDVAGIHVQKNIIVNQSTVDAIVGLTGVDSFDLLVMSARDSGKSHILAKPDASVKIAKRAQLPTLFVTEGVRGCINVQTGEPSLRNVLLAVDHEPSAQPAIARIVTMLQNIGGSGSQVTMLHVGNEGDFPDVSTPQDSENHWSKVTRQGSAASEIVKQAEEMQADLIVMVTSGQRELWDIIAGSTVQNVVKNAPCPVFTLPN